MSEGGRRRLGALSVLLGRRGWNWMGLALGATLVQALAENLVVVALVLLASALGILDAARLPAWMPARLETRGIAFALGFLSALALVRAITQATAATARHAMLEWVRARIQRVQGYRMLLAPDLPPVALSEAHLMMGDHLNKATNWCFHGAQLVSSGVMAASFLAGLAWLAPRQAVLALACLAALAVLVRVVNRAILGLAGRIPVHRATLERALVRISRNRVLIRVMHLEEAEYRRFGGAVSAYFHSSWRTFCLRDVASALLPLLGVLVVVLMVGVDVAFLHTPPVTLMGSVYLFLALMRRVAGVADQAGAMKQDQVPFDRAADLVFSLDETQRAEAFAKDSAAAPAPAGPSNVRATPPEITLRGVSFRWPGARRPTFERLDLHVPAGSRFGIVGPNGSGKTTLLHLILGLEVPQEGEVLVGGIPARDYVARGGTVSYVGTENLLVLGTLRDNLLYGVAGRPGDDALRRALDQVGLRPWLEGLEDGLDHAIGENEEGLSSGQKQRLSVARALLRRPTLLVLDEASASIDASAELEVASLLETAASACTVLIVSHKPGILAGVSHRIELPEVTPA